MAMSAVGAAARDHTCQMGVTKMMARASHEGLEAFACPSKAYGWCWSAMPSRHPPTV